MLLSRSTSRSPEKLLGKRLSAVFLVFFVAILYGAEYSDLSMNFADPYPNLLVTLLAYMIGGIAYYQFLHFVTRLRPTVFSVYHDRLSVRVGRERVLYRLGPDFTYFVMRNYVLIRSPDGKFVGSRISSYPAFIQKLKDANLKYYESDVFVYTALLGVILSMLWFGRHYHKGNEAFVFLCVAVAGLVFFRKIEGVVQQKPIRFDKPFLLKAASRFVVSVAVIAGLMQVADQPLSSLDRTFSAGVEELRQANNQESLQKLQTLAQENDNAWMLSQVAWLEGTVPNSSIRNYPLALEHASRAYEMRKTGLTQYILTCSLIANDQKEKAKQYFKVLGLNPAAKRFVEQGLLCDGTKPEQTNRQTASE